MAKNKTTETLKSVDEFIRRTVTDETKRDDSNLIIKMMQDETGFEPKMWGPSIIGFGQYHYEYESGHEGDMPLIAFSPRSTAIVLYFSVSDAMREKLLPVLGKHKTTKGCVYVKRLNDINIDVLKKLIASSVKHIKALYPDKKKK